MQIEPYSSIYETQLLELLEEEEKDSKTNKPYNFEFFKEEYGSFYSKFVALKDNQIVGTIVFSKQFDTTELNFIYVAKEHQGKGIAQELFQQIKELKDIDGIRVNCGQENKQAQRFYEKLGFAKVGEVENYFSNNNTQFFYWMKK